MPSAEGVVVANGEQDGRLAAVERLVLAVEELKLLIQMGKEVRAFASFQEFERAAELAVALSKQTGRSRQGPWPKGQGPRNGPKARPGGRRHKPKPLCALVTRFSGNGIVPAAG